MAAPSMVRTPDSVFEELAGYPFPPHWHEVEGLRMHYVDEGPRAAPVMLMVHGEPSWSYIYRRMIPPLVEAGYRCVAPDHIGFGRSDKVIDEDWYTIERHEMNLRALITALGLTNVTLVCHDWGGPIGLRQAVDMPERFARLVIMNTWLHHDGHEYTEAIRRWREASQNPAQLGGDMPTGDMLAGYAQVFGGRDVEAVRAAYAAPFTGPATKAGARRFPWLLPFAQPIEGNAADQARCFEALTRWAKPAHFIFGERDAIFTPEWARRWSGLIPGSTLDLIEGAGHFLPESHGELVAETILARIAAE